MAQEEQMAMAYIAPTKRARSARPTSNIASPITVPVITGISTRGCCPDHRRLSKRRLPARREVVDKRARRDEGDAVDCRDPHDRQAEPSPGPIHLIGGLKHNWSASHSSM